MTNEMKKIAIVMGSDSDWPIMKQAAEICQQFDYPFEAKVLSAHRTPQDMLDFAKDAKSNGFGAIIAGAGGAAHLPGMIASNTTLPVIGVPVKLKSLEGMDSLLSIVQMPKGVPVATVAIDNATNAALLALRMMSISSEDLAAKLQKYKEEMANDSRGKTKNLK
jgi:5-(carboxyamino)imidazole ribonucleotide mutase